MNLDSNLLTDFVNEAKEHLSRIENDFLELEQTKDNPSAELVNRIFRAVHTIKGSAGFFGLSHIGELSHSMETVLSLIRDKKLVIESGFIDILLEGIDMLNMLLDDIQKSEKIDITRVAQKVSSILSGKVDIKETRKIAPKIENSEMSAKIEGFKIASIDITNIPKDYCRIYRLRYNLNEIEKTNGLSPVKIVSNLLNFGIVLDGYVDTKPEDIRKGLPKEDLIYNVLYATLLDDDLICDAIQLDMGSIDKIDKDIIIRSMGLPESTQRETAGDENQKVRSQNISDTTRESIMAVVNEQRAESSGAPADSLRIKIEIIDKLMMLAGELVLIRNQHSMHVDNSDPVSRTIAQHLDIVTTDLQETIMRTRMQPIGNIFSKFTRIVRDIGKKLSKEINLEMTGNDVELDKSIIELLTDPLTHIIRNCCDHGIETPQERELLGKPSAGTIILKAYHEGGQVNIDIIDDGNGIDIEKVKSKAIESGAKTADEISKMSEQEVMNLIFVAGLSTASKVSDMSGRGVGMDVVKNGVERLGGVIELKATRHKGTEVLLRLPLTLAIIPSLIIQSGSQRFAIPQVNLEELVCLYDANVMEKIECVGNKEVYRLRDILLPMVHLDDVLAGNEIFDETKKAEITEKNRAMRKKQHDDFFSRHSSGEMSDMSLTFAVLKVGTQRYGLIIDKVIGSEEIVVKPMHRSVKEIDIYSGATVLGDGKVALIIDAGGISRHADIEFGQEPEEESVDTKENKKSDVESLLLFRNGEKEQFAVGTPEVKRIEKIEAKNIELVGEKEFITIEGRPVRIIRLENYLNVSIAKKQEEMYLLLPKIYTEPYGIIMSGLVDIGQYRLSLNDSTITEEGIKGCAVINDKMTLYIDMEKIIHTAEPQWFSRNSIN